MSEGEGASFEVPPPDLELRRLEPLIETWTSAERTEGTFIGRGASVRNRESFRLLEGGYLLVQS
jgi:hypothetical protein